MGTIKSSIACNLDVNILKAALPLFHTEKVQAIEWSFDALFNVKNIPDWFVELLMEFSKANRLIGHGIFFSLFQGRWTTEQNTWIKHLQKVSRNFNFEHITEHFGFMTGEDFHSGAPISIPFTNSTLSIGQDRLKRIYNACACPVGLENLAFSYSEEEVKRQGAFLDALIAPINGFIILDLHNLYCQLHNFNMNFYALIDCFPLERVREIHISGGSWEASRVEKDQKVRRDTHDSAVPEIVFDLLQKAIPLCRNLEYVVLEQIGVGLNSEESCLAFQHDFLRMDKIITQANLIPQQKTNTFIPTKAIHLGKAVEDEGLYQEQLQLSQIIETAKDYEDAHAHLEKSVLAHSDWDIENWKPMMLETAMAIAQKWM